MKASKFSDAQKAFILKQGDDGLPVAEIRRKAGISSATYFNWKKKYAGPLPDEMRRLKALEDENSRLKKVMVPPGIGGIIPPSGGDYHSTLYADSCKQTVGRSIALKKASNAGPIGSKFKP